MSKNNKGNDEELLARLKKIQEEEDRLYGQQYLLPVTTDSKGKTKEDQFDKEEESLLNDTEDPVLCKKLFYRIQSVVNSNIRKGELREFINNEKRLYLKSMSGSHDTRFSLKNSLSKVMDIVSDWSKTDTNGFDLGMMLYDLNEANGFHKDRKIIEANMSFKEFDKGLELLLNTKPPNKDKNK